MNVKYFCPGFQCFDSAFFADKKNPDQNPGLFFLKDFFTFVYETSYETKFIALKMNLLKRECFYFFQGL